jgi:hypothetical protein|uniref:zf-HC2 domain-containing protein n=1 Tax=Cephaloticoccus sp. TaxID=1985742 RepID=UPI00404B735C
MTCKATEILLLRDMDNNVSIAERAELEGHLASCPACRSFDSALHAVSSSVCAEIKSIDIPDADQVWSEIQARMDSPSPIPNKQVRLFPSRLWWSVPLAAAAALAFVFITPSSESNATDSNVAVNSERIITQADYVESGDPNASTMVYVDKESGWLVVWASASTVADQG